MYWWRKEWTLWADGGRPFLTMGSAGDNITFILLNNYKNMTKNVTESKQLVTESLNPTKICFKNVFYMAESSLKALYMTLISNTSFVNISSKNNFLKKSNSLRLWTSVYIAGPTAQSCFMQVNGAFPWLFPDGEPFGTEMCAKWM